MKYGNWPHHREIRPGPCVQQEVLKWWRYISVVLVRTGPSTFSWGVSLNYCSSRETGCERAVKYVAEGGAEDELGGPGCPPFSRRPARDL